MGFWSTLGSVAFGPIGGIVGGVADAGTELYQYQDQKEVQEDQMNVQREQMAMQKEFAQSGIRWKVEDARKAGLHPLAAMGAQTTPYQPVFADTSLSDTGMSGDFAGLGQDITRAIHATRTDKERAAKMAELELTHSELENDLLRAQIAKLSASQVGAPMAGNIPDSNIPPHLGKKGLVKVVPLEVNPTEPGRIGKEVGALNDYTFTRTADGVMVPVPSDATKQRIEDSIIPETLWSIRNNLLPNFGYGPPKPPREYLPKGANDWVWSKLHQGWKPIFRSREELEKRAIGGSNKNAIKPQPRVPFLDRSRRN